MTKTFLIDDFGNNSMFHKLSENSKKFLTDILQGVILDTFENHPGRKGGGSRPRGTGKTLADRLNSKKESFI